MQKIREILAKGQRNSSNIDFISIFFAGSALAKVLSKMLLSKIDLARFLFQDPGITPGFSENLALEKTRDITEFVFVIISFILLYLLNLLLASIRSGKSNYFRSGALLIASLILFSEATFLSFSALRLTLSILISFIVINLISPIQSQKSIKVKSRLVINGLISGFYLLILCESFFSSVTIPLIFFLVTPLIYLLFSGKYDAFLKSPHHLLLLLAAFFPYQRLLLLIIGVLFVILNATHSEKIYGAKLKIIKFLYALALVFIFAYNPLFYLGTFDPIEEGFWLGWLQRLLTGQVLYKDVVSYHPPFFTWGLYIVSKIAGPSIYLERLYFHLLKVAGLLVIYLLASKLLKNKLNVFVVFVTILVLTTTGVRNNVEVRSALGILSLFPLYSFFKTSKHKFLMYSGVVSAVALFSSLEVGIAVVITAVVGLLITCNYKTYLKHLFKYLLGLIMGIVPIIAFLWSSGSLRHFIDQMLFYTQAFGSGYLNSAIPKFGDLTLIQWYLTYKYLDSMTWFWEITLLGILAALAKTLGRSFIGKLRVKDKFIFLIAFYCLILLRAVLGRSDTYHLIFVLPISLILLANFLESVFKKGRLIYVATVFVFINIFFFRNALNLNFLQEQLIKFQSYGKAPGNYPNFDSKRAKILTGIDANVPEEKILIKYVEDNTATDERIFVYPWNPEVYFLADRNNATRFDTPLAFYSDFYQEQMVKELQDDPPKLILYNPELRLANLNSGSLPLVDNFIKNNYKKVDKIAKFNILIPGK